MAITATMKCEACDATTALGLEDARNSSGPARLVTRYARDWMLTKLGAPLTAEATGNCPIHGGAGYLSDNKEWDNPNGN